MTETKFLDKLIKDKKLQLVNPSEEIADSYIKKSESNLISAKILLENNKLEESVSLAYYSMYHLLTALLFRTGIKCENHTATILLLKTLFGTDNSEILLAKKERIDKQYYTNFHIIKKDVVETIEKAENFNKNLFDFISKLTGQEIEDIRKELDHLIKSGR